MGSVEARCSRPLTLRTFGGYPVGRRLSTEQGSRPGHSPWLGMFERSQSCSWRHPPAETEGAHAAWKTFATASGQRSSRGFRTSMKTCGCRPPLASGRRRSSRVLARAFGEASLGGRRLELWTVGCIDVRRSERAHAIGLWARSRGPTLVAHERRQRVRFGGATASRQGSGALPPPRASAREWQPIDPKPATRRQARKPLEAG
jgi:hypothetical protein